LLRVSGLNNRAWWVVMHLVGCGQVPLLLCYSRYRGTSLMRNTHPPRTTIGPYA